MGNFASKLLKASRWAFLGAWGLFFAFIGGPWLTALAQQRGWFDNPTNQLKIVVDAIVGFSQIIYQPSFAWIVALSLGCISGIAIGVRLDTSARRKDHVIQVESAKTSARSSSTALAKTTTTSNSISTSEVVERIFISVQPEKLTSLGTGLTKIQAKKVTEIYLDKWMSITGSIDDVRKLLSSDTSFIALDYEIPRAATETVYPNSITFYLMFSEAWLSRISILQKNQKISAIGRVTDIASGSITLEDCELISAGA